MFGASEYSTIIDPIYASDVFSFMNLFNPCIIFDSEIISCDSHFFVKLPVILRKCMISTMVFWVPS